MKFLLIISSFIIVHAGVFNWDPNVVKIKGVCFDKEVLSNALDTHSIAVDLTYNTIYFRHDWKTGMTLGAAKYDLNKKEVKYLDRIRFGLAQIVDQATHTVYFGVDNGVYKYDPSNDKVESLGDINIGDHYDLNAWSFFLKDILYYTTYPSGRVFTFANGKSTRVEDMKDTTADQFIIDNEDNMFYTNKTGFYSQKKGTIDAVMYRNFTKNENEKGRSLAMDTNGKVYTCLDSGLYAVDKATESLEKLLDFQEDDGNGIAFDKDNNLIYGQGSNLIRLKPNIDRTC